MAPAARAGVARVTERLLQLAVDADEPPSTRDAANGDVGERDDVGGHGERHRERDRDRATTRDVDPAVAVDALRAAYVPGGTSFSDVRDAFVALLPSVTNAAAFVVACAESLARRTPVASSSSSSSSPLTQMMLSALSTFATPAPRAAFATTDANATRVACPRARARAARLVMRVVRADMRRERVTGGGETTEDAIAVDDDFDDELLNLSMEPRAVARLVAVVGLDLPDLVDARCRTRDDDDDDDDDAADMALTWYVGRNVGHMSDASRVAAAVSLVKHFNLVAFATPAALASLVRAGHDVLADALAGCLDRAAREAYARAHAGVGTRAEWKRLARLGLPATTTKAGGADVERRLRALAREGRWDVANALAGEDAASIALMKTLTAEEDAMKKTRSDLPPAPAPAPAPANDDGDGDARFLSLDIPPASILLVDAVETLDRAIDALKDDVVIGLDTEWKPDPPSAPRGRRRAKWQPRNAGKKTERPPPRNPTALVQLAGERGVVLVDMLALRSSSVEVAAALRAILTAPRIRTAAGASERELERHLIKTPPTVVGWGLRDDLSRLAASYPGPIADAVRDVASALCLQELSGPRGHRPGLSAACEAWLGRGLDKSQTTSDWSRRPLTAAQLAYAAQDARVCVRLLREAHGGSAAGAVPAAAFLGVFLQSGSTAAEKRDLEDARENEDEENEDEEEEDDARASTPLPPSVVAAALRDRLPSAGGDPTIIELPRDTGPSASDVARALGDGVAAAAVLKTVALVIRGGGGSAASAPDVTKAKTPDALSPCVLLLRGVDKVDLHLTAAHFNVARRRVRLATAKECVEMFGYPPGSVPPLGHRRATPTVMDARARGFRGGAMYPGAGAANLVFKALPAVIERVAAAVVAPVAVGSRAEDAGATPASAGDGAVGRRHKFVADGALGRLARWLRCLGVDAEHVPSGVANEHGALLALARVDDRVILTRDRRLAARRDASASFLVDADDPRRQLAIVSDHFGLTFERSRLLSRCAKCNGEVSRRCTEEEVDAAVASGEVPRGVREATEDYWRCGRCEKIYWVGPKSHLAMRFIRCTVAPLVKNGGDAGLEGEDAEEEEEEEGEYVEGG